MIIEQTQISKTLIIFLEVESLKTGHELENDFEEFQELVNSAGAEIVDKSYSKQSKPSISHFINKGKLEEIMINEGILKESEIVYSLGFNQIGSYGVEGTKLENMWGASGPVAELDFDVAIEQARKIYKGMFPNEEFLPRAPDPEEIVLGEDAEANDVEDVNQ